MHKTAMDTEWFKDRKKMMGVTDAALAEALGVERSVANKVANGKVAMNARRADDVAKLLQVSRDDILFRAGISTQEPDETNDESARVPAPDPGPTLEDFAAEHGIVFLEELDLALGMGATFLDGTAEVRGIVPFKQDWLSGIFSGSMQHLKVVRGKGDSMQPTIMDGDLVIVDMSQRRIDDQDRIWAVAYGDFGMIRRIRVTHRGSWLLMPDNAVVRPDEVSDGEAHIMGRVIWIGRRI